jgi:hypothetical protein
MRILIHKCAVTSCFSSTYTEIVPPNAYYEHHKTQFINIFSADTGFFLELPFVESGIKAGFPSPSADFIDMCIDMNYIHND